MNKKMDCEKELKRIHDVIRDGERNSWKLYQDSMDNGLNDLASGYRASHATYVNLMFEFNIERGN